MGIRRFLSAPYWIHLLVDIVIGQVIWWGVTMFMKTPIEIQSIIAGLILIATIFAVALYLPKLSTLPPKKDAEQVSSATEESKISSTVAQTIPIAMSRGLLRTDDYTCGKLGRWLLEQLTREKNNPQQFFQVHQDWFGLYLNSVSGPYLLFRFAIRTSAMHSFAFQLQYTTGHIYYMNQDLARTPEVEEGTHDKLNRETQNMLTVKQFLEPITAQHLRELHDSQRGQAIAFGFSGLRVYLKAMRPDGSIDADLWLLPMPGSYTVKICEESIRA